MYAHGEIEKKWRDYWKENSTYAADTDAEKEKCYVLAMFPYPSGDGLHVGHARSYIGTDIYARLKRMRGYRVLHPIGWDAFGLPAEEYAIRNRVHPREATERNIRTFKEQCETLGLSYDWDREINTTDPAFYRWTQWIFLQLYKKGLAYESYSPVNWCPSCKTGLANEDLEGGVCERCGSSVARKPVRQWVLRITDYADRLLNDLDALDGWPDHVREVQRNWIGRSEGYRIPFRIGPITAEVFTTRPETLFGCSFLALSPESGYVDALLPHIRNADEVRAYRTESYLKKKDAAEKEAAGVLCEGVAAVHPLSGDEIPVYAAEYVLGGYGTGAVFASPAHDARDFSFAKRYNLPVIPVIRKDGEEMLPFTDTPAGSVLMNSGAYDGMPVERAVPLIVTAAGGKKSVSYRLQDWVFSRQRYWGEPIPIIHCGKCGAVPVPEKDLPVTLPEVASYEPTGTGESPLAAIDSWVRVPCPACGGSGRRETNTMPQWAGSSWYHLRYLDPRNRDAVVSGKAERRWMPVDVYVGGMEHAARHLIYARFWHKVLRDIGVVSTDEPYCSLKTNGVLQAEGGGKMSKRLGNVVRPESVSESVGVDALRVYLAHSAPFSRTVMWDSAGIAGPRRFLERVYAMREYVRDLPPTGDLLRIQHRTIRSVIEDIEAFRFNTAVSSLMAFSNAFGDTVPRETYTVLIQLLAPFAPYLSEELWHGLGYEGSVHLSDIPGWDENLARDTEAVVAVQVKGKTRGTVTVPADSSQEIVCAYISRDERLRNYTEKLSVKAFVPGKIISFV